MKEIYQWTVERRGMKEKKKNGYHGHVYWLAVFVRVK